MIWANPFAWIGLLGIALPVLVHLLARGHARVHKFPSLRFISASRLLPTRVTRLRDIPLLIVRAAIIALAIAALARPVLLTRDRRQSLDRGLALAIVVDTSASMRRATATGGNGVDSARRFAEAQGATARTSITIETNDPAAAIPMASTWLARQGRRAQLLVISDFQTGQVDSVDIAGVPASVGVVLQRVAVVPAALEQRAVAGEIGIESRATLTGDRTSAEWSATKPEGHPRVWTGARWDRDSTKRRPIEAITLAAGSTVPVLLPFEDTAWVGVWFPEETTPAALSAGGGGNGSSEQWTLRFLAQLLRDSLPLRDFGMRSAGGKPGVGVHVFTSLEPGSLGAARVIAAARRAISIAPPARELEPGALPDATLAALERAPAETGSAQFQPTDSNGPSDARWLWIAVLALLVLEYPLRRTRRVSALAEKQERPRAA